jgi:hypothetical protein
MLEPAASAATRVSSDRNTHLGEWNNLLLTMKNFHEEISVAAMGAR